MIKLGIFIIPNQQLKKIILKFKKIVQNQFGNQTYLKHLLTAHYMCLKLVKKIFKK